MRLGLVWYVLGGGVILSVAAAVTFAWNPSFHLPIAVGIPVEKRPVATDQPSPPSTGPAPAASIAAPPTPAPQFDVVRVEPGGDAVVAGHAEPHAFVELRDGERVIASTTADDAGEFVIVPNPLAAGSHSLRLASRASGGQALLSDAAELDVPARKVAASATPRVAAPRPPEPKSSPVVTSDRPAPAPSPVAASPAAEIAEAAGPAAIPSSTMVTTASAGVAAIAQAPKPQLPAPAAATAKLAPIPTASPPQDAPKPTPTRGAEPKAPDRLAIRNVAATEPGRLEAEGTADPNSKLRLSLNGAYLADVTTGADGAWSLTIERGMIAGLYSLEAEQVEGAGIRREETQAPFVYPQNAGGPVVASTAPLASPAAGAPKVAQREPTLPADTAKSPQAPVKALQSSADSVATAPSAEPSASAPSGPAPVPAAAAPTEGVATTAPSAAATPASPSPPAPQFSDPSHAVVAEVRTTTVVRGDNLWDLARRFYNDGMRYTDIFAANAGQIKNPNLIFIGQVFVVPQRTPTRP